MRARMLASLAATMVVAAVAPGSATAATGYVLTCDCANAVTVIDTATRSVVASVPVGSAPTAIAVTRDGRSAFTANAGDATISVIDGVTRTVTRTIALAPDDAPIAMAVSPDGATLYVLLIDIDTGNEHIARVDVASGAIIDRVAAPVFLFPGVQLLVSPDGTNLYAASPFDGDVWRFDLTQPGLPATDITPGAADHVTGVAVAPDGILYLSDADDQVLRLTASGLPLGPPIPVPPDPDGFPVAIALDATGAHAWLAGTPFEQATAIDTTTGAALPATGIDDESILIAVSPDGDGVYLGSFNDPVLHVVDPQTRARVATIALDDIPVAIAFGPTPAPAPPPPALARPVVTSVTPAQGPAAGGQEVTIAGANFGSVAHVLFGDTPSPAFRVTGFNEIVATVPPSAAGGVDVRVVGPDGQRSTEKVTYRYTAEAAPGPGRGAPGDGPSTSPPPSSRPACVVPDVRGLRLRGARKRLKAAHCTVGTVTRLRHRRNQRVVRQSLRPGTERPGGWGVALAIRPRPGR